MATDTTEGSCIWFVQRVQGRFYHNWISNFHIEPDGSCVEYEYQAEKHDGHPYRQMIIRTAATPGRAKQLGRKWKLTKAELRDWNRRKGAVMYHLCEKKLLDNPEYFDALMDTEGPIIEENTWHDNYWGNCTCVRCMSIDGENMLGKIYMTLRRRLA
jgi:ribA/ribD-fused uncharacterized protein